VLLSSVAEMEVGVQVLEKARRSASGGQERAKPAREFCQVLSADGPTLLLACCEDIDTTTEDEYESIIVEDNWSMVLSHEMSDSGFRYQVTAADLERRIHQNPSSPFHHSPQLFPSDTGNMLRNH
jgi:hypothetical protein